MYFQVCLEGQISRKSAMKSLSEGRSPSGDQIPWKFCEQFQDNVFPSLSGARIVRIAVHPSALRVHSFYIYVTWFTYVDIILYIILCSLPNVAWVWFSCRGPSNKVLFFTLLQFVSLWHIVITGALLLILNFTLLYTALLCTWYIVIIGASLLILKQTQPLQS